MRFQVPQFIEVEDKIFGSLTIKQFIYLAGGGGLSFILYTFLNFYLAILAIIPVAGLSLALAFYKVNNRSFVAILEAGFKYLVSSKLYIWKKHERQPEHIEAIKELSPSLSVPKLSDSKLKDLTWSLDVNDSISPGTDESMKRRE